ncbi:MAG: hypothetical protein A3F74_03720 [Betaproteobacteria bacterium RIFCSPLOWO2_12_FULL_62_58]|nr:MAG: hypothetical protein A3F74_03720 [Betaproteobacteria bacterium RIFCSPLOWO2_12_FULL_62_58]
MLKRKLAGVVVAGLLLGAGAVNAAESAFPGNADEGSTVLPALSTYADQHRGKPDQSAGSPFPAASLTRLPALSTYADRYRGVQHAASESAFPISNATD